MSEDAILIHGWDPSYYNSKIGELPVEGIAWSQRPELVANLSKYFNLSYYNLPGFSGQPEPEVHSFDVENYANGFYEWKTARPSNPSVIIGYSFGGAVALMHKVLTKDPTPTILISPAIYRGESLRSGIGNKARSYIPEIWEDQFRHLYQMLMSKYYREGTPFLRNTYNRIVRRDLRNFLNEVDSSGIFLIYGEKDMDTPWSLVQNIVLERKIGYHVVASGAHNIGQTHPQEIVDQINSFLLLNR